MSAFDSFLRAKFGDIEFPWEERTIHGTIREHEHQYPHSPGAALETLGRNLYVIRFRCSFHDTFKSYPDLYPSGLARIRRKYETEERDDLVIPGIGTIKAVLIELQQNASVKEGRSGERVDMSFKEDMDDAFLVNNLIGVSNQSLNAAKENWGFNIEQAKRDALKQSDLSLFDSITASVNSVLAVVDTVELYGNVVEAKIQGAAQLIYQADRRVKMLNNPENATLTKSMVELQDALLTLYKDVQKTGGKLQDYAVKKVMSVTEIAQAIYSGDGSRAAQIMQLNALDNPFAVQPGTVVRYYPVAA